MQIRNPFFPAVTNTFSQGQTFQNTMVLPNGATINQGDVPGSTFLTLPAVLGSGIGTGSTSNVWLVYCAAGAYFPNANNGDIALRNASARLLAGSNTGTAGTMPGIELGVNPSASTPAITSGTVYTNASASYQTLYVPITYSSTSSAAATAAIALGASSIPSTIFTNSEPAGAVIGKASTVTLRIPPGWYYSVTVTNATIGTPMLTQE